MKHHLTEFVAAERTQAALHAKNIDAVIDKNLKFANKIIPELAEFLSHLGRPEVRMDDHCWYGPAGTTTWRYRDENGIEFQITVDDDRNLTISEAKTNRFITLFPGLNTEMRRDLPQARTINTVTDNKLRLSMFLYAVENELKALKEKS